MARNAKLFRWLTAVWLVLGCQDQPTDASRPLALPAAARVALPTQGPGDVPAVPMPSRHAVPRPWDASDAEFVKALQESGGRAVVAFKNPGSERALKTGIRAAVSRGSVESGLALLESRAIEVVARLWFIGAVGVRIDPSVAVALRRHPLVDYIEPEQIRTLDGVPGDRRASAARVLRAGAALAQTIPWGMYLTQFPAAWRAGNAPARRS